MSADLAGIFAAWSVATTGNASGRLALAADAGTLAQLHLRGLTGRPERRTMTTGAARVAYQLGTAGQSAATQMLLLQQLVATMHALYEAAKALGQAHTAERLATAARRELADAAAALEPAPGRDPGSGAVRPSTASDLAGLPNEAAAGIRIARQAGLLPAAGDDKYRVTGQPQNPAGRRHLADDRRGDRRARPRPEGGAER